MSDRYAMCPRCGRRLHRQKDIWGDWDGETYICERCATEAENDDARPYKVCPNCDGTMYWEDYWKCTNCGEEVFSDEDDNDGVVVG